MCGALPGARLSEWLLESSVPICVTCLGSLQAPSTRPAPLSRAGSALPGARGLAQLEALSYGGQVSTVHPGPPGERREAPVLGGGRPFWSPTSQESTQTSLQGSCPHLGP